VLVTKKLNIYTLIPILHLYNNSRSTTHYSLSTNPMSDSLMFNNDAYVVLETGQPEELLTPAEMFAKLKAIVIKFAADLPIDVQQINGVDERVQYLLDTSCELDLVPGEYLQWYVVRLEK
jgi:Protein CHLORORESPIRATORY REDUCTION 7